jgi:HD-GYP domain-containing protein (c-di-GMP phosphodiesterase class II)
MNIMIEPLLQLFAHKNHSMYTYSNQTARFAKDLAIWEGYGKMFCEEITLAATLHDIGKMGIPNSILNKPDFLNTEEFGIMKLHPLMGHSMVEN